MATPTYTAQDAIDMATALNHKSPVATMRVYAVDLIYSRIWTKFPWNWSKASLVAIPLVDGTQDYSLNSADLAAFYRFVNLEIQQTSVTPIESRWLSQKNHLSVENTLKGGLNSIRQYSWESTINKLRLNWAASVPSGTTLQIAGEYQTVPTKLTVSNLATPLLIPDHYFNVFLEGVRWKFYELTDDSRSGQLQEKGGEAVYTGQLGIFMDALSDMAKNEDFSDGEDISYYPSGGTLGTGRDSSQVRIFG